jgi:dTMP kinase
MPDLTLILDLPPEEGLRRVAARAGGEGQEADRFEAMSLRFHQNLRQEFLEIAEAEPWRCAVIDAGQPPEKVAADIWAAVCKHFDL